MVAHVKRQHLALDPYSLKCRSYLRADSPDLPGDLAHCYQPTVNSLADPTNCLIEQQDITGLTCAGEEMGSIPFHSTFPSKIFGMTEIRHIMARAYLVRLFKNVGEINPSPGRQRALQEHTGLRPTRRCLAAASCCTSEEQT